MKRLKIADLFCGAGGTSAGACEAADRLGYTVDLTAINHWPVAIDTHSKNHPSARHLCTSIDDVNPRSLYREGELDILLASPECTHHSNARGGKPINDQSRATAWCVIRWAEALRPSTVLVENVPEFASWGGLGNDGRPLKSKKGLTFQAWCSALESLGYHVTTRELCAADYGDPTTRTRLFVQAVRGKRKAVWPEPTHAKKLDADLFSQRRQWVPAREIIDWSLPSQSIFDRKRPLSAKTMKRIFKGLEKFGLRSFVASWDHQSSNGTWSKDDPLSTVTTKARHGVVEPFLVSLRGGEEIHLDRCSKSLEEPIPTVTAGGLHHAIVSPYLVQVAHAGNDEGRVRSVDSTLATVCGNRGEWGLCQPMMLPQHGGGSCRTVEEPVPTVACAGAIGLIEPFIVKYNGTGGAISVNDPLDTVSTRDRFGLARPTVTLNGNEYVLDIKFRMLQPSELALAQGFPKSYRFSGTKTQTVKQIGNAVPRRLARAIVAANISQNSDVSWIHD